MSQPKVQKGSSGLGLFATKSYKKGDRIIEYTGEVITEKEANRRGGKYLFELNDSWTIDGKGRDNLARYINHSCLPNAYPELTHDEKKVFIYAKKKISEGEEISYNYGKDYFNRVIKPLGCRCQKCTSPTAK